jgi:hypothetical protein
MFKSLKSKIGGAVALGSASVMASPIATATTDITAMATDYTALIAVVVGIVVAVFAYVLIKRIVK